MKIGYFDLISGASGDMLLGALVDAGVGIERLVAAIQPLGLPGWELRARSVTRNGFRATKVDVMAVEKEAPERHLSEILALVTNSSLPENLKAEACAIFKRIGEVEARIHNTDVDSVHLHELSGIDTLVDVVGTLAGIHLLEIENVIVSPLPLGRGLGRSAHGPLPLPAPATLALLEGFPVVGSELSFETVTPTGAALLTHLADSFGPIPEMRLQATGYGAGSRDLPVPNVLRLLVGESSSGGTATIETLVMLETNIDDLNPQVYDYLMERLFAAVALDVTLTPIQMKKNRPAIQVGILCRLEQSSDLEAILFAETSTLGIRKQMVERHALPRSFQTVETPYGPVRVKRAEWQPGKVRAVPEYEDCKRLAEASGVPLREVYEAALKRSEEKE